MVQMYVHPMPTAKICLLSRIRQNRRSFGWWSSTTVYHTSQEIPNCLPEQSCTFNRLSWSLTPLWNSWYTSCICCWLWNILSLSVKKSNVMLVGSRQNFKIMTWILLLMVDHYLTSLTWHDHIILQVYCGEYYPGFVAFINWMPFLDYILCLSYHSWTIVMRCGYFLLLCILNDLRKYTQFFPIWDLLLAVQWLLL